MAAKKAPAATAKKKTTAKTTTKKAAAVAPVKKIKAIKERYNKTQLLTQIAEDTSLSKKDVSAVLESLTDLIEGHIQKRGCGEFVLPGLMKIITVKKPAKKARKNVPNPFKPGELMDTLAKPASIQIKVRPLKKLKEMSA